MGLGVRQMGLMASYSLYGSLGQPRGSESQPETSKRLLQDFVPRWALCSKTLMIVLTSGRCASSWYQQDLTKSTMLGWTASS